VSANYSGTNGTVHAALLPSISANGQYIAFESGSFQGDITPAPSDLVPGLTVENDAPNIYLRDQATKTTICLSVDYQTGNTTGTPVNDNGSPDSRYPIISANGNTVVFLSNATNLTANDYPTNNPNNNQNVFAWVRTPGTDTGTVRLISVNFEGTAPANDPDTGNGFGTAENISVSANGDYVAFDSEATDLVPNASNIGGFNANVYVRDLLTNTTILVSASTAGAHTGGNAPSNHPVISADGSTVAYDSEADNLDPTFTPGEPFDEYQVYASRLNYTNDTVTDTKLLSLDPTGKIVGNGTSTAPSVSDNGEMVAFMSNAENLVTTPNGGSFNDVYERDLNPNTTQLVSVNDTNTATGDKSSFSPQISGDGDDVLFYSNADDLTNNATDGIQNVFEWNLTTKTTKLVSVSTSGTTGGNGGSTLANQTLVNAAQQVSGQISDNGQFVVFQSVASNLVPNFVPKNTNLAPNNFDVYWRDIVNGTTRLLSHAAGLAATGDMGQAVDTDITPNGLNVAFQSAFHGAPDNLGTNDASAQTQLYDANLATPAETTLAAVSGTGTYGGTGTLTAIQIANGTPISGQNIAFTLDVGGTVKAVGSVTTDLHGIATLTGVKLTGFTVGTAATVVGASYAGNSLYADSNGSGNLTVAKAPLTVTATSVSQAIGQTNPTLKYTITGFVNGDTASVVSGAPVLTAIAGKQGTYPITVALGSLSAKNYPFPNLVNGVLTVGIAPINDDTGAGHSDPAVFRRTSATSAQWFYFVVGPLPIGKPYLNNGQSFGSGSLDVSLSADFDGDGRTDLAVYRPSTGQWFVEEASTNFAGQLLATFGGPKDIPVPADYTGNGKASVAVYRPTTGQWFFAGQAQPLTFTTFKTGDIPVPGNYDNTVKDEPAVYLPSTGQWIIDGPNGVHTISFGGATDIPVPGAYNALTSGNAAVQPAVWRPTTGQFFIRTPSGGTITDQFKVGDISAPGDYDGIGETEAAVYRPSTSQWLVMGPNDKTPRVVASFGGPNDTPTAAPYEYRALKSGGGLISKFSIEAPVAVDLGATARSFAATAAASTSLSPQTNSQLQPALSVLMSPPTKGLNIPLREIVIARLHEVV
jgi:MBG domain (YGX type)